MITPESLLSYAIRLREEDSEEAARAVISRAYYASFHHLRDIAEDRIGLPAFGTTDDHAQLQAALGLLDTAIADDFRQLRRARNFADYALRDDVPRSLADFALDLATRLLAYS